MTGPASAASPAISPDPPRRSAHVRGRCRTWTSGRWSTTTGHGKLATITGVEPPGRFGALQLESDPVRAFQEKPEGDGAGSTAGSSCSTGLPRPPRSDDDDCVSSAGRSKARRRRPAAASGTEASGSPWTPCAMCGPRKAVDEGTPRGRCGRERSDRGDLRGTQRSSSPGHTGFKGAWLAEWLGRLGAKVTGYALDPPTQPNLFEALDLRERLALTGRTSAIPRRCGRGARPPAVGDLPPGRAGDRPPGYAEPHETFETNVMGTVNVLEARRELAHRCGRWSSSPATSATRTTRRPRLPRDRPDGRRDPYSASKGCAELVTAAYRERFFADGRRGTASVASVRAGNVIGGGDWAADRIIPDCVRALGAGEPFFVRNPDAVRPWQHVLEPLSGYLWLAALLLRDGRATRALELRARRPGRRPAGALGGGALPRGVGLGLLDHAADAGRSPTRRTWLSLDSAKAREQLGWAPRLGRVDRRFAGRPPGTASTTGAGSAALGHAAGIRRLDARAGRAAEDCAVDVTPTHRDGATAGHARRDPRPGGRALPAAAYAPRRSIPARPGAARRPGVRRGGDAHLVDAASTSSSRRAASPRSSSGGSPSVSALGGACFVNSGSSANSSRSRRSPRRSSASAASARRRGHHRGRRLPHHRRADRPERPGAGVRRRRRSATYNVDVARSSRPRSRRARGRSCWPTRWATRSTSAR